MIVVSDTSPISNLFLIGELKLLHHIYNEVLIPNAVMNELKKLENFNISIEVIKQASWIKCIEVKHRNEVQELLGDLDLGEAEAIVLAKNLHADWLLIDETKGRKTAKDMGLQIVGLLGVLLLAKKEGLIHEVKSYLEKLITKTKFRMTQELFDEVLVLAGEVK